MMLRKSIRFISLQLKQLEMLTVHTRQRLPDLVPQVSFFLILIILLPHSFRESRLFFKCAKASQKLHALSRVSKFMTLNQRKIIMESFFLSHFGYCPLVWMFHSRTLNNRINRLHKRALQIVYNDYESSFDKLLDISGSFKIHERNIQTMAIELYKIVNNLAPTIMSLVFQTKPNPRYPRENILRRLT